MIITVLLLLIIIISVSYLAPEAVSGKWNQVFIISEVLSSVIKVIHPQLKKCAPTSHTQLPRLHLKKIHTLKPHIIKMTLQES